MNMFPQELRQYSNRKLFIALGAVICVAFLTTTVTLIAVSRLMTTRQVAQVNNTARSQLQTLLLHIRTAESRERAFLLSGDPIFADRYATSIKGLNDTLADLERQTQNLSYRDDVLKLRPLIADKMKILDDDIKLRVAGTLGDATTAQSLARGRDLIDQIDSTVQTIEAKQDAQINHDRNTIQTLADIARDVSIGTLALTLILAAIILYLYLIAIKAERQLDMAKDEFVSLASHQLRTPASGIKSILATILTGDFGPLGHQQQYFLQKALDSNERELRIIDELLNVARADAGRLVLHSSDVDLGALIESIVSEQRPAIESKGQSVTFKPPPEPVSLIADEEKLHMAISNIIDNARKYTPDGGRITVAVKYRGRRGIRIEISDTGQGIDPKDIPHIFDRFQRARDVLESQVEGTGLGLYLARRIITLHNGSIDVTSKKGHGTRFIMVLPFRKVDAPKSPAR